MDAATVEELGKVLKALASESRIALLVALQRPLRLSEIDLTPSREGWGPGDRTVSRQAVRNQLRILEGLGVVRALTDDGETRYVVHHARLYEVTERLRELATVRPEVDVAHETISMRSPNVAPRPTGAHLVLVRGVREGQVFPLAGESPEQGWLIGRAKEAAVALDYDPYVSTAHARVLPRGRRPRPGGPAVEPQPHLPQLEPHRPRRRGPPPARGPHRRRDEPARVPAVRPRRAAAMAEASW
jgi:hypothetical protein